MLVNEVFICVKDKHLKELLSNILQVNNITFKIINVDSLNRLNNINNRLIILDRTNMQGLVFNKHDRVLVLLEQGCYNFQEEDLGVQCIRHHSINIKAQILIETLYNMSWQVH